MLSKQKQKFLKMIMRESVHKSFGKHILGTLTTVNTENFPKDVSFNLIVPHSLCRSQHTNPLKANGDSELASSAVLAIFDELSTNNLMLQDKTFRAGVSIHLTTEALHPIPAEHEVVIRTTTDKIGAVIGFCSMELLNAADHKLLARGKHIKFMPHGRLWDMIAHPMVLPSVLNLYHMFKGNKFSTVYDNRLFNDKHEIIQHKKGEIPIRELVGEEKQNGFVFQQLNVQSVTDKTQFLHLLPADTPEGLVSLFKFKTSPLYCNQLGALHGGAVATLAEEVCSLARREISHKLNVSMAINKLETKYLNSMQGELIIRVVEDVHSNVLFEASDGTKVYDRSIGALFSKQGKLLCAEFVCVWKLL